MTSFNNDSLKNELSSEFIRRNDLVNRWGNVISSFQFIPGLVGFWPMSSVQRSTGNVYDLSGQGRTLTYNGNPTFSYYKNIVPYVKFDGTGDYLSRADETDLDVTGTEAIYGTSIKGLTVGGWFWFDALSGGSNTGMMEKFLSGGNQRSWSLFLSATDTITFGVSSAGTATNGQANGTSTVAIDQWYFAVGRFRPSLSVDIYVNAIKEDVDSSSVPASIFNSTAPLEIGRFNGVNTLNGIASLCFMSSVALSDPLINMLFQQSRTLFDV